MAIDARIPLLLQPQDYSGKYQNALLLGQRHQQNKESFPLRNQLLEADARYRTAHADLYESRANQVDQNRKMQMQLAVSKALMEAPAENRAQLAESFIPVLQRAGVWQEGDSFEGEDFSDEVLRAKTTALESALMGAQHQTAGMRDFAARMQAAGFEPGSPEYKHAAMVEAGVAPRAGISAAERIATTPGLTQAVGASEGSIARDKGYGAEFGKLLAAADLKPEVEAAVKDAVLSVEDRYAVDQRDRDNKRALAVYDAAMSGLVTGLGGTSTGPGMSWLPALTANAQIAEGAIAATAPVLKQLFRQAGEGNFTDSDQKILMDMLPTRDDLAEARVQKFRTIDAIVRAKLLGEVPEIVRDPTKEEFEALPSGAIYIWNWEAKRKP